MQETYQWGYYKPEGLILRTLDVINFKVRMIRIKKIMTKLLMRVSPVFDVEYMGSRFRCYVRDNSTERNIVFFHNNPPKVELQEVLNSLNEGDIFVDIGANCGLFTVLGAIKVGKAGKVLAIEPNSVMVDRLKYNVLINNLSNVEICEVAVGRESGEVELHIDRRQYGKSSIVGKNSDKIIVKIDSLDSITQNRSIDKIDLLKIDIEGYEYYALSPFFDVALRSKWPNKILIETTYTNKSEKDPIEYLISKGYKILWSSKNDALLALTSSKFMMDHKSAADGQL